MLIVGTILVMYSDQHLSTCGYPAQNTASYNALCVLTHFYHSPLSYKFFFQSCVLQSNYLFCCQVLQYLVIIQFFNLANKSTCILTLKNGRASDHYALRSVILFYNYLFPGAALITIVDKVSGEFDGSRNISHLIDGVTQVIQDVRLGGFGILTSFHLSEGLLHPQHCVVEVILIVCCLSHVKAVIYSQKSVVTHTCEPK